MSLEAAPEDFAAGVERQVRALGRTMGPDVLAATQALYRPWIDPTPAGEERQDVPFGEHPLQKLDLYQPRSACRGVVVNVHGGGFIGGDKNGDGVFNRNVGRWLARHGYAAVLPNYRLAPEHAWPCGARDVQAALEWVERNREPFGWVGRPLVVWGQSAGATHVASCIFDHNARGAPPVSVSAVMLLNGIYEVTDARAAGTLAYFGGDEAVRRERSPLTQARDVGKPMWLGMAELDPPGVAQQTFALGAVLSVAQACCPNFHVFRGHNHVSPVQSLGSPQMGAGEEILGFLARVG